MACSCKNKNKIKGNKTPIRKINTNSNGRLNGNQSSTRRIIRREIK